MDFGRNKKNSSYFKSRSLQHENSSVLPFFQNSSIFPFLFPIFFHHSPILSKYFRFSVSHFLTSFSYSFKILLFFRFPFSSIILQFFQNTSVFPFPIFFHQSPILSKYFRFPFSPIILPFFRFFLRVGPVFTSESVSYST